MLRLIASCMPTAGSASDTRCMEPAVPEEALVDWNPLPPSATEEASVMEDTPSLASVLVGADSYSVGDRLPEFVFLVRAASRVWLRSNEMAPPAAKATRTTAAAPEKITFLPVRTRLIEPGLGSEGGRKGESGMIGSWSLLLTPDIARPVEKTPHLTAFLLLDVIGTELTRVLQNRCAFSL